MSADAFAPVHDEATGRRWRYRLPVLRVTLSIFFCAAGVILLPLGLALPSLACTVVGGLVLLPGLYATYSYYKIWTGTYTGSYAAFLETEELD